MRDSYIDTYILYIFEPATFIINTETVTVYFHKFVHNVKKAVLIDKLHIIKMAMCNFLIHSCALGYHSALACL